MSLLHVVWVMRDRRRLLLLAGGIIAVILLSAAGQVRLNSWQGAFYDAIDKRDVPTFMWQLGVFFAIIAVLVVLGVGQTWLQEMVKLRLRQALTRDLLDKWLQPRRAYRLGLLGEVGVNPDQRLQEDVRHLTELTANLGIGLFQSSVLLVSFVGVLWTLSEHVVFPVGAGVHVPGYMATGRIQIPGYMVWCALIYASAGSALTYYVGRPLIRMNADHYAREADLRFSLVRVSESSEGIALDGGESAEREKLELTLNNTLTIMRRLVFGVSRLTWVTSTYGYIALVVPIAAASPGYFAGTLSFGQLMQVVAAFLQVQQALRWFVDNFAQIADWSATFLRVMTLYDTLVGIEQAEIDAPHIKVVEGPADEMAFEDLSVLLINGQVDLEEGNVTIKPGEHVQIIAQPGAGKLTLFRAIAGLWPSGTGTLRLPPRDRMIFLPQRPYLPSGTLRAGLNYPQAAAELSDEEARTALLRVGLDHYVDTLDQDKRWDRELTASEQQAFAFARVLVRRPGWVVMDGALDALDREARARVMSIFTQELPQTAVISIGVGGPDETGFSRTLHAHYVPGGPLSTAPDLAQAEAA